MNQIYKVIWSKARNCYVVVSEIAKRNSKSAVNSGFSVTRNILAGAVLLGLTAGICAPVWAAVADTDNTINLDGGEVFKVRYASNNKDIFTIGTDGELKLNDNSDHNLFHISNTGAVDFFNNQNHLLFHIGNTNHIVYWGAPTSVTGEYATAWGQETNASGKWSTAWGLQTNSTGEDSTAFGQLTRAEGKGSTAWGANTQAKTGDNTTAFGQWSEATGRDATAFGYNTYAKGEFSTAWGNGAWTSASNQTATPGWDPSSRGLIAEGQSSTAFGYSTYAKGTESTAFGHLTNAIGQQSTAWGNNTYANGDLSTAFGERTIAGGNHSTAFGYLTEVASGADNAVAWGEGTKASANHATAFGYNTLAVDQGSLATGHNTVAKGLYSASFGQNTRALGQQSIAFGYGNVPESYEKRTGKDNQQVNTYPNNIDVSPADYRGVAGSNDSLAGMGGSTYADSQYSLAYGADAKAKGNSALAFGENAKAGIDGSYEGAIALGKNTVSAKNGVALGNKSVVTTTYDNNPGYNYDKKTVDGGGIWTPTEGNLSIGNVNEQGVGQTRRIQGVAAGYADTDAVNVAQLKTVVGGAVAGVETVVKPGANVKDVPKTTEDGHPVYTVNVENLGYKVNGTAAPSVLIKDGINFVNGKNTKAELKNGNSVTFNAYDTIVTQGTGVTVNGTTDENTLTRTYTVNTKPMTFGAETGTFTANLDNSDAPVKVVGDGKSVTTKVENNQIKVEVNEEKILEGVSLKFAGDDGSEEAKVITKANGNRLDIVGGAALTKNDSEGNEVDALTDGNIGVVYDNTTAEQPGLHIKLAKDITGVDNITVNETVNAPTVNTTTINLGDTSITYEGDRINYTKKDGDTVTNYQVANTTDIGWNAYVGSVDEKNKAGTVDIDNKDFTFIAGDNVTIDKGNNAITINSASFEAGDGITISKDATTNKYKISLNVEGGVTPTDTVTVEPKSSTGSETAGGEATTPGTTGGETAGSGTSGAAEAGKTVTITSDTNSTAFTDDKGTTFVTVTPTSIDDETSDANNLQIKGDGTNISTVATSNGQDKGGSIEVKLKDDITVKNVTVNETVNVGGNTTITGDTITTKNIEGDTITGDTINATTVNGDTINTKTINLGDNISIQEGDDNRITYKSGDTTYNIATTEDGMDFAGDDGKAIHKDLTEQLDVVGGAKDKASEYNIYTYNDGDKLRINLAKDINGVDSVTVNNTINVGGNTTITGDTITTNTFKAGDTTINNDGLTINEGPSITKNKVDVAGNKIINVAPGEDGTDAVNVDQLNNAMNQAGDVINRMGDQISRVDSRMRKGLAGAAALAALHPMDFDPDDKLTFAAGVGNYRGENAAAVGAFYRPDEKVMFSIGGTMGNGENMVNAGISFSLDRVAHVTNSKTAMAREILDLRKEVTELKASLASGNWMLDPTLTRLFPDTEENHWAYEYVKTLAGNHIIEGYPDGEFKGDRMITRYEMAAILYRAMMNGAQLPDKALNEFAPELGRFRVDRVYGNGDDRHKVERIRVNDENRKDRDVYGSRYEYFKQNPGANVSTGALPGTKQAEKAAKAEAEAKKADKPSIVSEKAAS